MENPKSKKKCQIRGYETATIIKVNKNGLMIKYTHVKIENVQKSAFFVDLLFSKRKLSLRRK